MAEDRTYDGASLFPYLYEIIQSASGTDVKAGPPHKNIGAIVT